MSNDKREMPSFIDGNKVENVRENRDKVMKKIGDIISGNSIKAKSKPVVFSFYTPPQEPERKIGDRWIDSNGYDWEQFNGYKVRLPKIDANDVKGYVMPHSCPKCHKPLKHQLDQKMWRIHELCFDCVQDFETDLRAKGLYKEYERQRIMANIRSYYKDVLNSLDDFINGLDATYVNEFGDVENWNHIDKNEARAMVLHDMALLKESFEKEFNENFEK